MSIIFYVVIWLFLTFGLFSIMRKIFSVIHSCLLLLLLDSFSSCRINADLLCVVFRVLYYCFLQCLNVLSYTVDHSVLSAGFQLSYVVFLVGKIFFNSSCIVPRNKLWFDVGCWMCLDLCYTLTESFVNHNVIYWFLTMWREVISKYNAC